MEGRGTGRTDGTDGVGTRHERIRLWVALWLMCGRCHANVSCLLLMVILGLKEKKVTGREGTA